MLNSFLSEWNSLFPLHKSTLCNGKVVCIENDCSAKNKTLAILCSEAISFPSKQFSGYDLFGALSNKNCDAVFLIKNEDGSFDVVYVEMKSRFDTEDVDKAKVQIVETRSKMLSLFRMMKSFSLLSIRKVFGIIETLQLDEDQIVWWSKQQLLPEERMKFGEKLLKNTVISVPTGCKPELNVPSQMSFRLVLSDKPNYYVDHNTIVC